MYRLSCFTRIVGARIEEAVSCGEDTPWPNQGAGAEPPTGCSCDDITRPMADHGHLSDETRTRRSLAPRMPAGRSVEGDAGRAKAAWRSDTRAEIAVTIINALVTKSGPELSRMFLSVIGWNGLLRCEKTRDAFVLCGRQCLRLNAASILAVLRLTKSSMSSRTIGLGLPRKKTIEKRAGGAGAGRGLVLFPKSGQRRTKFHDRNSDKADDCGEIATERTKISLVLRVRDSQPFAVAIGGSTTGNIERSWGTLTGSKWS